MTRALIVTVAPTKTCRPRLAEALRRRRTASLTGACPCGATTTTRTDRHGLVHVTLEHERDCPVLRFDDAAIARAITAGRAMRILELVDLDEKATT